MNNKRGPAPPLGPSLRTPQLTRQRQRRGAAPAPRHRGPATFPTKAAAGRLVMRIWSMWRSIGSVSAEPSAGASVAPLLRTLRRCGFCRLARAPAPALPRAAHAAHDAYCGFALAVTSTYLGQELIYAYQERGDMARLASVMFLLLCHVTSIAKQLVFMARAPRLAALIEGLDDTAYNPSERERAALLARRARGAARLGTVYARTATATCTLWAVFPLLARLQGASVQFALWMPFDYNASWPGFLAALWYTYAVTTLVGVGNTTMDALIATLLGQCSTQLTILRMDFASLAERAAGRARATGEGAGAAAAQLLVRCVAHHHKICRTAREVQAVFGGAVLLQFAIGGWILCMATYKLVELNVGSLQFVSIVMFLLCILTELFLYCYYGNEVAVESAQVAEAVYGMRWEARGAGGAGRGVRRALPLVLACSAGAARGPLRPAALFIPLSLETFVTILRSSYTFYTMLRQTQAH